MIDTLKYILPSIFGGAGVGCFSSAMLLFCEFELTKELLVFNLGLLLGAVQLVWIGIAYFNYKEKQK